MPEIATFGKRFCFYFYKTWEKAKEQWRSTDEANKAAETRRLSSQQVNLSRAARVCPPVSSRWEDNPLRTGAAVRVARAPCSFGGGLVGPVRLRR